MSHGERPGLMAGPTSGHAAGAETEAGGKAPQRHGAPSGRGPGTQNPRDFSPSDSSSRDFVSRDHAAREHGPHGAGQRDATQREGGPRDLPAREPGQREHGQRGATPARDGASGRHGGMDDPRPAASRDAGGPDHAEDEAIAGTRGELAHPSHRTAGGHGGLAHGGHGVARGGHVGHGPQPQPARPPHGHVGHAGHGPSVHGPIGEGRAPRPPRGHSGRAYAALDLGTNNCRLLVAEPLPRGFRVVDAFSRIVRLGEGIGRTGELAAAAMDRAIEALDVCRRKLAEHDVARARLIATEACRSAANGALFIDRVRREVGLELEIVTRETEARLAVTGCASLVDPDGDGAILFDIGGGSSELVWIDFVDGPRRDPARCIRAWTSLPVGVVTLSERHGGVRVDDVVFEAMVDDVADMLRTFPEAERLDRRLAGGGLHMLGTSGTVTTLAGVFLDLKRYDRRRVDGAWLTDTQVGAMVDRLRAMSYDDRVEHPCIGGDRADLVLAGCAILEAVRRRWPCSRLRVADRGLREGILTQLMRADRVWDRNHSRFRQS